MVVGLVCTVVNPHLATGLLNLIDALNVRTGVDSTTTSFNPALSSRGVYALFRTGPEITFTESFNSFFRSDNAASASTING